LAQKDHLIAIDLDKGKGAGVVKGLLIGQKANVERAKKEIEEISVRVATQRTVPAQTSEPCRSHSTAQPLRVATRRNPATVWQEAHSAEPLFVAIDEETIKKIDVRKLRQLQTDTGAYIQERARGFFFEHAYHPSPHRAELLCGSGCPLMIRFNCACIT
jgi:hypothetical protein